MPLPFDSISHGTVAFGFFNIDSDMLLLENYFLFATEFCEYISAIGEITGEKSIQMTWQVYHIPDPRNVGDLMGAIHGVRHTGFIGEVYRWFPFPGSPEDFKQKSDGFKNQAIVEAIIKHYAILIEILFFVDRDAGEIAIGHYRFTRDVFQELIRYVWQGGYPRWKDEIRPDYVVGMKDKIGQAGGNPLFKGLVLG
ncbi:MAG: hypothetical protein V1689_05210 [Pseudomonadota bacterium]